MSTQALSSAVFTRTTQAVVAKLQYSSNIYSPNIGENDSKTGPRAYFRSAPMYISDIKTSPRLLARGLQKSRKCLFTLMCHLPKSSSNPKMVQGKKKKGKLKGIRNGYVLLDMEQYVIRREYDQILYRFRSLLWVTRLIELRWRKSWLCTQCGCPHCGSVSYCSRVSHTNGMFYRN